MDMTKKQKRLLIFGISFLCLCAILFSCFWFIPYRRHWNFKKTPIEHETLLAYPDSVICRAAGENKRLNDDQIEALWARLGFVLTGVRSDNWLRMPVTPDQVKYMQLTKGYTCVELRYDQRHKYMGKVLSNDPFEYDAILLIVTDAFILPVPYLGCTYRDTIGPRPLSIKGSVADFDAFVKAL